ncbi:hypothetical protein BC829DRAFT_441749 [Chytridium lagenaria]|nr:hypothetical protein BC829DRAFT_441749 [Chytridium lagenaria]
MQAFESDSEDDDWQHEQNTTYSTEDTSSEKVQNFKHVSNQDKWVRNDHIMSARFSASEEEPSFLELFECEGVGDDDFPLKSDYLIPAPTRSNNDVTLSHQYTGRQRLNEPRSSLSAALTGNSSNLIIPTLLAGIRSSNEPHSASSRSTMRPNTTSSSNSDALSTTLCRMLGGDTSLPSSATPARGSARTVSSLSKRGDFDSFEGSIGIRTHSEEDMMERIVNFATALGAKAIHSAVSLSPGMALSASVGYPEPHEIVRAATSMGYGRRSVVDDSQRFTSLSEDDYPEGGVNNTQQPSQSTESNRRSTSQRPGPTRTSPTSIPLSSTSDNQSARAKRDSSDDTYKPADTNSSSRNGSMGDGGKEHEEFRNQMSRLFRLAIKRSTSSSQTLNENHDIERREERQKLQRSEAIIRYLEMRRQEYHEQIRQELIDKAEKSRLKRQRLEEAHQRHIEAEKVKENQKKEKSKPKWHPTLHRVTSKSHQEHSEGGEPNITEALGPDEEYEEGVERRVRLPAESLTLQRSKRATGHLAKHRASVMRTIPIMISLDRKIGISAQTLEVWGIDADSGRKDPSRDKRFYKFNHMADTALRNKKAASRLVARFADLPFRDFTTGIPIDPVIELGLIEDHQFEKDLNDVATLGSVSLSMSPEPMGKLTRLGKQMAEIHQRIALKSRRGVALVYEQPTRISESAVSSHSLAKTSSMLAVGSQQLLLSRSRQDSQVERTRSRSGSVLEVKSPSKSTVAPGSRSASARATRSASLNAGRQSSRANSVVMFADQTVDFVATSRPRTGSRVNFSNHSVSAQNFASNSSILTMGGNFGSSESQIAMGSQGQSINLRGSRLELSVPTLSQTNVDGASSSRSLEGVGSSTFTSLDSMQLQNPFLSGSHQESVLAIQTEEPHRPAPRKPKILPLKMDDVLSTENVRVTELKHLAYFKWQMPQQ